MQKISGGIVLGGLEGWTTNSFPSGSLSSLSLLVLQFCRTKFQHYLVETDFGASVRAWRVRKEMAMVSFYLTHAHSIKNILDLYKE